MPADDGPRGALLEVLRAAVSLSQQMLAAAEAGDWERLAALESERSRQLTAGLAPDLKNVAAAAEAKVLLASCLRLNDQISALTSAHMTRLERLLAEMATSVSDRPPPQRPNG